MLTSHFLLQNATAALKAARSFATNKYNYCTRIVQEFRHFVPK